MSLDRGIVCKETFLVFLMENSDNNKNFLLIFQMIHFKIKKK